jgi:hypothetical protein
LCQWNESARRSFNDESLVNNRWTTIPQHTIPAVFGTTPLCPTTGRALVVTLFLVPMCSIVARIKSRLDNLFRQVHLSPPSELCSQAALESL